MAAAAGAGPVRGPLPELGHVGADAAAGVATRVGEGASCDRKSNFKTGSCFKVKVYMGWLHVRLHRFHFNFDYILLLTFYNGL